jgi:hypothetical protein
VFYNTKHFVLVHPDNREKREVLMLRMIKWAEELENEVKFYFITRSELKTGCYLLPREKMTFWNPALCQIIPAGREFDKAWDDHGGTNEVRVRICN